MPGKVLGAADAGDGDAARALPQVAAGIPDVANVGGDVLAVDPDLLVGLAVEEHAAAVGAADAGARVRARVAPARAEPLEVVVALVAGQARVVDPGAPAAVVL